MKKDKYILDKYLQDKVEEASFEMQEAHWQKAMQALDETDNGKKSWGWLRTLVLAGIVLLISGVTYLISNKKSENNTAPIAANTNAAANDTKDSITTIPANTDKVNKNSTATNADATNSANEQSVNNQAVNNTPSIAQSNNNSKPRFRKQHHAKAIHPIQAATQNDNLVNSDSNSLHPENDSFNVNLDTNATAVKKPFANRIKEKAVNKLNTIKNTIAKSITKKPKEEKEPKTAPTETVAAAKGKSKKTETQSIATNNASQAKTNVAKKANKPSKKQSKGKVGEDKKQQQAIVKNNATQQQPTKSTDNNKATIVAENIPASFNYATLPIDEIKKRNPKYINDQELKYKPKPQPKEDDSWTNPTSTTTTVLNKKQNTDTVSTIPTAKQKFNPSKTKSSVTVTANASMVAAPKDAAGRMAWKPSPYFGFGYWMPLTNRWDLQFGAGATYINGLQYNYTAANYRYGFGVDSSLFSIQHKTLYQLCLPLSANYKLSLRQSLMMGLGANLNLDVLSSVKQFNSNTASNAFGYRNGYNVFAPFISLGYQYQMMNHWFLQASYQQGLSDYTNNTTLGNTNVDRGSRVNVGVTYKIK